MFDKKLGEDQLLDLYAIEQFAEVRGINSKIGRDVFVWYLLN